MCIPHSKRLIEMSGQRKQHRTCLKFVETVTSHSWSPDHDQINKAFGPMVICLNSCCVSVIDKCGSPFRLKTASARKPYNKIGQTISL